MRIATVAFATLTPLVPLPVAFADAVPGTYCNNPGELSCEHNGGHIVRFVS